MNPGFLLFVDEAGDEGLERVRPLDQNGSSEFFVMSGVLIRAHRYQELRAFVNVMKESIGLSVSDELHFRDLDPDAQLCVVSQIGNFRAGLIVVASNKRNMRRYRNKRVEAQYFEIDRRGNKRPQHQNWFYNHIFRYLLETASAECARWTKQAYGSNRPVRIIFSHRKAFRYSQTRAYLQKLRVERRDSTYYNNKHQIDWTVIDPSWIDSVRSKSEPGLQFADCVASAVFKAIDETSFKLIEPNLLRAFAPRIVRTSSGPEGYGFKLLPNGYRGPFSQRQKQAFRSVGYVIP